MTIRSSLVLEIIENESSPGRQGLGQFKNIKGANNKAEVLGEGFATADKQKL